MKQVASPFLSESRWTPTSSARRRERDRVRSPEAWSPSLSSPSRATTPADVSPGTHRWFDDDEMDQSYVDLSINAADRPDDDDSLVSRSRATSSAPSEGPLKARSPSCERAPAASLHSHDELSDSSDLSETSENSEPIGLASRSVSPRISRCTSPLAAPLATSVPPSPEAPRGPGRDASSAKLPVPEAPARPSAPLSLRQSCALTAAGTIGAIALLHGTRRGWQPHTERLLLWSQEQFGAHVVNPAIEALSNMALWLSRFGYHPPAPAPIFNPLAEWHEIARRVERLGQAVDGAPMPGLAWVDGPPT